MTASRSTGTSQASDAPSRVPGVVALCGLGLLGILGYALTTMVPRQRAEGLAEWSERLSALAEDRRGAIEDVVRHVEADAAVLSRFPSLIRFLGTTRPDPDAARHLDEVFRAVLAAHGYSAALVLDHDGATRLTVSAGGQAPRAAACQGMALAALRTGTGPHFTPAAQGHRMACFAADVVDGRRHLGVVVLAADPDLHLFPLLTRPVFMAPATTLTLVEELGGTSVAVGPPGPDHAADGTLLPPARGGSVGPPLFTRDRSGAEVLEVARGVGGTAWQLRATAPKGEVLRAVDHQAMPLELVITGLVLALTGLGFGLWRWRRSDAIATRAAEHREALARLRRVFDAQGAVAIGIRPNGVIFEWNRAAEQYFGCSRLEVLGRHMEPDQPPAPQAERGWRTVAELAAATDRESVEVPIELPDGQVRLLGWSTTAFPANETDPGGTIVIGVDVTAARRAEDDLRRSEERYRLLFDANPEPMWVYDTDTLQFLAVNDAAVGSYGYSRSEFLAMTIEDLRPAEEHPALARALARPWGASHATGIWCHRHRDGDLVQVEVASHDITFAGRPARLVLATDVTERVRREADLARLNAAVTQSAEAVIITDMEPRIVYVNPAFEQITGFSRAEVLGRNPNILKSGEQGAGFYADLWGRLRAGQPWKGPLRNRRKDGRVYLADAVISPIRDPAGRVVNYVGLQRDITHEHQLAEQLRQAQKMEAVGQLTGGIAHDFNNLLGVILANSELLRTELARDGAAAGYLEEIATAGTRGAELVHKLLAFSRQELIELRPMDLARSLPDLLATLRRLLPESIDVRMDVPPRLPPILGDRGAIEQMLLNLATNARDAMPTGGTLVFTVRRGSTAIEDARPSRRWDAAPTGQTVQVVVSDSGQGMSRQTLDRIFEPFFTTKGPGRGTGLGMAMVYGLMKQHGGFVDIFSAPGEGSTVCLHFPIAAVTEEAAVAPAPPLPGLASGHETILLVEDEPPLRRAATRLLERMGYQVLAAADGIEALEVYDLHREHVALVVSDMIMPRLGGAGLLRELRQRHCRTPFLLATGYSASTVAHEVLTDPLVSFLEKPWTATELGRRVRECLDAHPAPAVEALR